MAAQDALMQGIIDAINAQSTQIAYGTGVVNAAQITFKASSATSVMLWNKNSVRRGAILVNTDANDLYIRFGTTASTSSGGWTYKIPSGATWEMPQPIFGGRIDGIWSAAGAGVAEMTEM